MFETEKKVALFQLLQFGYCSQKALILCMGVPSESLVMHSDEPMEVREYRSKKARECSERVLARIEKSGWVCEKTRKTGELLHEKIQLMVLTKEGMKAAANVWDDTAEKAWAKDGKKKRKKEIELHQRLVTLYRFCKDKQSLDDYSPEDEVLFSESVKEGIISPMARFPFCVDRIKTNSLNTSRNLVYRNWRLGNILALFSVNDFLTPLDRRPLKNIMDETDLETEIENEEPEEKTEERQNAQDRTETDTSMTISQYTNLCMESWFQRHPESYMLRSPWKDIETEYAGTPAFYSASELYAYGGLDINQKALLKESKNVLRHSIMGLAIGKYAYCVYHTKIRSSPWQSGIESNTLSAVQKSMENMGYKEIIDKALIIIPTHFQFDALFKALAEDRSKVGQPYQSLYLIPVNGAGAMEIRALLLAGAGPYMKSVIHNLLKENPSFQLSGEPMFPLRYNGTPVFCGQLMEYRQLIRLRDLANAKQDFLISCFPEQANWYRRLIPGARFV